MDHSNSVFDVFTKCLNSVVDVPTECLVKVMEFIGDPIGVVRLATCCKTLHKNLYPEFLVMCFKFVPWIFIQTLQRDFTHFDEYKWRKSVHGFVFDKDSITALIKAIHACIYEIKDSYANDFKICAMRDVECYVTYGMCLPFIHMKATGSIEINETAMKQYYIRDKLCKYNTIQFKEIFAKLNSCRTRMEPSDFMSAIVSIHEHSILSYVDPYELYDYTLSQHETISYDKQELVEPSKLLERVWEQIQETDCIIKTYADNRRIFCVCFSNDITLSVVAENYECGYYEKFIPTWYYSCCIYLNDQEISTKYPLKGTDEMILSLIAQVYVVANSGTAKRLSKHLPKQVRQTLRKRLRKRLQNVSTEIVRATETREL